VPHNYRPVKNDTAAKSNESIATISGARGKSDQSKKFEFWPHTVHKDTLWEILDFLREARNEGGDICSKVAADTNEV
jgi:hypothetical protein